MISFRPSRRLRHDARRQDVEDGAGFRRLACEADIACRDPQPAALADATGEPGTSNRPPSNGKREQAVGRVVGFGDGIEADGRVAADGERQRRIALQACSGPAATTRPARISTRWSASRSTSAMSWLT